MTFEEFKIMLPITYEEPGNQDKEVVVNYQGTTILDIAVRIGKYTLAQLQEATALLLTIPGAGSQIYISLGDVNTNNNLQFLKVSRVVIGNFFVYHFSEDARPEMSVAPTPNSIIATVETGSTNLTIIPGENVIRFDNSDFNILYNSVEENTLSRYIVKSDRNALYIRSTGSTPTSTVPGNFNNIISGTADLAQVQDSNYTDTGWIAGRYVGTSTNRTNYRGIDPAFTGIPFEGSSYSVQIADNRIFSQSDTERVYDTFILTDTQEIPSFVASRDFTNTQYQLNADLERTETSFILKRLSYTQNLYINAGDVIGPEDTKELMKVDSIVKIGNQDLYTVNVQRGWNSTGITGSLQDRYLKKIRPVTIFEIDGNKLNTVKKSKIKVKDSDEVLYIDQDGMIISGTILS